MSMMFTELTLRYSLALQVSEATLYSYGRMIAHDIVPVLGGLDAELVMRSEVRGLLAGILARDSPNQAVKVLRLVKSILAWGVSEDLILLNQAAPIKPPARGRSRPRERVLTHAEIRGLLRSLRTAPCCPQVRLVIRFQLLTAQRPGEVLGLQWADIVDDWWTIPGARRKGRTSHRVPLTAPALAVLAEARKLQPASSTFVFASPLTHHALSGTVICMVERKHPGCWGGVTDWTPHDLRRTGATLMAEAGVDHYVIAKVLGHADPSVTAIYNRHGYGPEKRAALEILARVLGEIERSKKK